MANRAFLRPRFNRPLLLLAIAAVLACALRPARSQDATVDDWCAHARPALELYIAGRYADAQQLLSQSSTPALSSAERVDYEALRAMCLLRGESRADREAGRTSLLALATAQPALLNRPECALALGVGLTALHETAAALLHLHAAVAGFHAAGQPERRAAARVALAQAWAAHGEWEAVIPGVLEQRPANPAEAERLRLEHVRALRAAAAEQADPPDTLDRIDLVLAQVLLNRTESGAAGVALLREIATRPRRSSATAEACLLLGARLEADGDVGGAADLYARVADADLGSWSETARRRRDAVQRPALALAPVARQPDSPTRLEFTARNISDVRVEWRRIDLADWLTRRQGRLIDAHLPDSGALVATRDYHHGGGPFEAWQPPTADAAFELARGAYVAVASAQPQSGEALIAKQLVIVGELSASIILGPDRILAWARDPRGAVGSAARPASLRFWQSGAFVARSAEFREDLAWLDLPGEARSLRDKRWVALVECDGQWALCRGELPASVTETPLSALLCAAPSELPADGTIELAGLLLRPSLSDVELAEPWTVQALDALGRVRGEAAVNLDGGVLHARIPLADAEVGDKLRLALRAGRRIVPLFGSAPSISVVDTEPALLQWRLEPLPAASAGLEAIRTAAWARFECGRPLSDARLRYWSRGVQLPVTALRDHPRASPAVDEHGELDASGYAQLISPLKVIGADQPPAAVGVWATVRPPDGRPQLGMSERLLADTPAHLWVLASSQTVSPGDLLRFRVGWFDPLRLAGGALPTLTIHAPDGLAVELPIAPGLDAYESDPWLAPSTGRYRVHARLPLTDGSAVETTREVLVSDRPVEPGVVAGPPYAAVVEATLQTAGSAPRVRVTFAQPPLRETLLLAESAGPLAAVVAQPKSRDLSVELSLPAPLPDGLRLRVIECDESGVYTQQRIPLATVAHETPIAGLQAQVENSQSDAPTVQVRRRHTANERGASALMLRLADMNSSGTLAWVPGSAGPSRWEFPDPVVAHSIGGGPSAPIRAADSAWPDWEPLPARVSAALFAGRTIATAVLSADSGEPAALPLPAIPGQYRLFAIQRSADGRMQTTSIPISHAAPALLTLRAPPRLSTGDRAFAYVAIELRVTEPTPIELSITADASVHLGNLQTADDGPMPTSGATAGRSHLTLQPGQHRLLRIPLEAVTAGAARLRVAACGPDSVAADDATLVVRGDDAPPPPEAAAIFVRRAVFLLEPAETLESEVEPRDPRAPIDSIVNWNRRPLTSGEPVPFGALLLVEDNWENAHERSGVRWEQFPASNTVPRATDLADLRTIGGRRYGSTEALTYEPQRVAAGVGRHEFLLVALRPGVSRLAPPRVRDASGPIAVRIEPADFHVVVPE